MKKYFALVLIGLVHISCSKNLWIDKEPNIDTKLFKTYSWNSVKKTSPVAYYNQAEIDQLLRSEVEKALNGNGYVKVDDGSADFFIDYNLYIRDSYFEEKICPTGFYGNGGYSPDLNTWPRCDVEEQTITYDSGTLVFDVIDTRTGQLVWRGSAANIIDNPRYAPEIFAKRVRKLLKKFNNPV